MRVVPKVASSTWPQLWLLQLAQSGVDPKAISGPNGAAERLLPLLEELRSLSLDRAEWGLIENLLIGRRGTDLFLEGISLLFELVGDFTGQ